MAESTSRHIEASDGVRLHFRHWPALHPTGVVVALHGIQSHSGWYEYSSERMAESGQDVYFADRRGSGLNGKARGHADHGARLINDVRQLVRLARRERPNLPITLLGISWGGKTAAALTATFPNEVDRLALLYPGLFPRLTPNRWQRFKLNFARRHDVRFADVRIPLDNPALFTSEPSHQEFIRNDPIALHFVTSGLLNAGRDLDLAIQSGIENIQQPILVMLAGEDQVIDNSATRQFVSRFPSESLSMHTYPAACHTLEYEPNRVAIVDDLVEWLQRGLRSNANRKIEESLKH